MTAANVETAPVAAIYARISKKVEAKDKVANQVAMCRDLAQRHGYVVAEEHVYSDDGISAYADKLERPGLKALTAAVRSKTRPFDVLLAVHTDRIGRPENVDEGGNYVSYLRGACKRADVRWHTVHQGPMDLNDPTTQLISLVLDWQAGQDSATKVGKIKDDKRLQREAGHPGHGPRPFGYSSDRWRIVEPEAALIREGARMLLAGEDRMAVVRRFNESGLATTRAGIDCPSGSCTDDMKVKDRRACSDAASHLETHSYVWRASAVFDTLSRWRNCSVVEHQGQPQCEGTWPAILSRVDVENVRVLLATPPMGHEVSGRQADTADRAGLLPLRHPHARPRDELGERLPVRLAGQLGDPQARTGNLDGTPGRHSAIKIELLDEFVRMQVVELYHAPDLMTEADDQSRTVAQIHIVDTPYGHRIRSLLRRSPTGSYYQPHV